MIFEGVGVTIEVKMSVTSHIDQVQRDAELGERWWTVVVVASGTHPGTGQSPPPMSDVAWSRDQLCVAVSAPCVTRCTSVPCVSPVQHHQ